MSTSKKTVTLGEKISCMSYNRAYNFNLEWKKKRKELSPGLAFLLRKCRLYSWWSRVYVGYSSGHLHQRVEEHKVSAIGKDIKSAHKGSLDDLKVIVRLWMIWKYLILGLERWHNEKTKQNNDIERIQKRALRMIYSNTIMILQF